MQFILCFSLSAAVHAAATFSVTQDVTAAYRTFSSFASQACGIVAQQHLKSVLPKRDGGKAHPLGQALSRIAEAVLGLAWILMTFSAFCEDPGLTAAIKSPGKLSNLVLYI